MDTPRQAHSRRPLWLVEGLDVAESRAWVLWGVAGAVSLVGIALTIVVPGVVPPAPLLGAAIALASVMLGFAAATAVDAAALVVRGPRHVRAAGGDLVAVLPSRATASDGVPLARAVLEARPAEERLLLGLAPAGGDSARTVAWAGALGAAIAEEGASVLSVDLASGRTSSAGLAEALEEGRPLASVAELDGRLPLARLGAGHDPSAALTGLGALRQRLPRDLDVLLVALPVPVSRDAVTAARDLDHLLLIAERDRTSRVELIATLDALERVGIVAQVVLVDDWTVGRLARGDLPGPARSGPAVAAGPARGGAEDADAGPEEPAEQAVDEPAPPAEAFEDAAADDAAHADPPVAPREREADADVGEPASHGTGPTPAVDRSPEQRPEEQPRSAARPPWAPPRPAARPPSAAPSGPVERPAPDDLVEPRDTEVLGAARAAGAAHDLERRPAPGPAIEETDEPSDGGTGTTAPQEPAPQPTKPRVPAIRTSPAPEYLRRPETVPRLLGRPPRPRDVADADPREPQRTSATDETAATDELPRVPPVERVEPVEIAPEEVEADGDDVETTAHLAMLLDEIEARPEGP